MVIKFYPVIAIVVLFALPTRSWAQQEQVAIAAATELQQNAPYATLTQGDSTKLSIQDQQPHKRAKRDWATWKPNPKRALWLGLILPGAGQIYNQKFWKLPIIYGGMVGCAYAIQWNNQMYRDYAQAYMDIMDNDPTTASYTQFVHLGTTITSSNIARYQELFRSRKERYRRWRDLSIFTMIGVYALSVIDAYVDASLSEFDISNDLSLRVEPAVIKTGATSNPLQTSGVGLHCSLTF